MSKIEKSKYGKMLLEIFRVIKGRMAGLEKTILFIAENNGGYMFGGTFGQMEKIIELNQTKDKLEQLNARLKTACKVIMARYKDLFIASVHPDLEVRERLTREIKEGLKYRIYFNRLFDKMTADLFDEFFDESWTLNTFLDFYKNEPCVKRGLDIAEHYYKRREEAQKEGSTVKARKTTDTKNEQCNK